MVVNGVSPLSQSATTAAESPSWTAIDAEFRSIIAPTTSLLANDDISPAEAGDSLSLQIKAHLENWKILKPPRNSPSCNNTPTCSASLIRRTRRIEATNERLRILKNSSRKHMKCTSSSFFNLVRAHNKTKKACVHLEKCRELRKNEKAFRSNPWHFSKSVCSSQHSTKDYSHGTGCSQDEAYKYFSDSFAEKSGYSGLPSWVNEVMPVPSIDEIKPFDMSPITPGLVKAFLKKCSSSSTPGVDQISYHILKKLPSCHHFLATLFSKLLLYTQEPPKSWRIAKIILIHKKGDTLDPGNYRPIALTSAISKLFHKIIATRLEQYAIDNNFLDSSTQKGFLHGVNGCMEHIFALQTILSNAKDHHQPLSLSFIDLKNAFGSISHCYLFDMLKHINIPSEVLAYLESLYSSISAFVSTKQWKSPSFSIKRGVFQGDTLSPMLFLIAFNPIVQSIVTHPARGFSLVLNDASNNPTALPKVGSYIYALWDEDSSDEKQGWYLAKVLSTTGTGQARILYRSGKKTEEILLSSIK